jgi:SAM-dependent methyltransferase
VAKVEMGWHVRNMGAIIVDRLREEFIHGAFMSIGPQEMLLDLGCGNRPFRATYDNYVSHSIGVDMPFSPHLLSDVQVYSSGMSLPFKDGVFDIVLCSEVMEHVNEPELLLREISRVLRSGGFLVMTTPFMVPMHEEPHDYFRYTIHGLKYLCSRTELTVRQVLPFSEMIGVALSFIVEVQLKVWNALSKAFRFRAISSLFNPFILLFVYLPQKLYVSLHRFCSGRARLRAMIEKLSHTTIGYGLIAQKKFET